MEGKNGLLSLTLSSRGGEGNPQSQFCQTQVQKRKEAANGGEGKTRERTYPGPLPQGEGGSQQQRFMVTMHAFKKKRGFQ